MRRLVAFGLSLTLLSGAASASAEAAAEALFRAGREALKRGSLSEACARFEESYRLEPAVGTLLNLALCEERRGHVARAWELFSRAASDLPSSDARLELARRHVAELARRVPTVVLRTDSTVERLELTLDGLRLGTASLDVPLPIEPGRHVVEVRVGSQLLERREFDAVETGKYVLDLQSRRAAERETVARPEAPSRATVSDRTASVLAFGGAASLFVLGGVTGLAAIRAKHVVEAECNGRMECSQQGVDAASRGKSLSIVSTSAFVLGVVALGAGLIHFVEIDDIEPSRTNAEESAVGLTVDSDGVKLAF